MTHQRGGPKRAAPLSFGAQRDSTLALALLVLVGGLLRAWPVAEWPISHLEALTWHDAREGAGLADFPEWNHPPLSFVFVRLTVLLLGTEAEWALRLPSLAAGLLCVPVAFLLGRAAHSARMGLLFATFVAFDPVLIDQARTARMYSLLALLVLVAFWRLAVLVGRHEARKAPWVALGLVWAAATWTHTSGFLLWLAIPLPLLLASRDPHDRKGLAVAAAAAFAAGLVPIVAAAISAGPGHRHWLNLSAATRLTLDQAAATYLAGPVGIVLVGAALAGLWILSRQSRVTGWALGTIAIACLLAVALAARDRPYGIERYLIPWRLALHGGLAGLAASVPSGVARWAAGGFVAALSAHFAWGALPRELPPANEVGAIARAVRDRIGNAEAVTYQPLYLTLVGRYYELPFEPRIRPEWGLPPGRRFDRTWILAAHPSAMPTFVPGRTGVRALEDRFAQLDPLVRALAADYGAGYDRRALFRRFAQGSLAIAIDGEGIRILGSEDGSGIRRTGRPAHLDEIAIPLAAVFGSQNRRVRSRGRRWLTAESFAVGIDSAGVVVLTARGETH